jgi:hypothetical protein
MEITLPTQLVNATLQYLATRPYQEVAALIAEIQKHGQAQEQTNGNQVHTEGN